MADRPKTLKEKQLKDIRPVQGSVRLQSKRETSKKQRQPQKVIQNAQPNIPMENLEPPTEEAAKIISQINNAKLKLVESMRRYSKLLDNSVLQENKSEKEKQEESYVINELVRAAQTTEKLEPGEGLMSLCVFSIRLSLLLRDANNKLSYDNYLLENRVKQLEKTVGVEPPKVDLKAKEKQLLLKQAKELGIKINIED